MSSPLAGTYRRLTSLPFVPKILLLLAAASVPGTLLTDRKGYFDSIPFTLLLATLALSLSLCTLQAVSRLRLPVLLIHAGFVIVCCGGIVRWTLGWVATVNLYEGMTVDAAYRWDRERDLPLGFAITLERIGFEFHPARLRVGVLKNGEKYRLVTTAEGEGFDVDGIRFAVDRFDPENRSISVTMTPPGGSRVSLPPSEFPTMTSGGVQYGFRLVAWRTPDLRRSWVDLTVRSPSAPELTGSSEVNAPLRFQGVTIHHTANDADQSGRPFAGLQIVKDPGRPVVFTGMVLVSAGGVLLPFSRRRRRDDHV